ncbi:MAG: hypothetical protein CM1200mP15_05370 [Dehalococcoidia bacterium]|nr:MAG: hypothetical protein CM1200mP15_05370 [Dehalococcoidia bacterium]
MNAMPYSITAELRALTIRNFIPDSVDFPLNANAAKAANGNVVNSNAM